jgi:hypothetical protein
LPGWKRAEWKRQPEEGSLVTVTRKTDEDDDEEDSEMTLNRYKA